MILYFGMNDKGNEKEKTMGSAIVVRSMLTPTV